ncbi:ankyrin repeat domain-containing protein [Leptospira kmetyi]|uniref:ankyrin repeat domain-containing protein n=1 Tax=Leptospira kmetyi TaxID=408139 RepID=UPI003EBA8D61
MAQKISVHDASQNGDLEMLRSLIEKGENINAKNKNGFTPLHLAKNLETAKLLIQSGADVNARDKDSGNTPFHVSIQFNQTRIAKLLIENGADINAKNDSLRTPIFFADRESTLKFLLESGAVLDDQKDAFCRAPLYYSILHERLKVAKLLIQSGADINVRDERGMTPLIFAIRSELFEFSKLLIEQGADPNLKDEKDGKTPLMFLLGGTFLKKNLDLAESILQKGADLDATSNSGSTALHFATFHNDLEAVRFLLDRGAQTNLKNRFDKTPLNIAIENNHAEIVALLKEFPESKNS